MIYTFICKDCASQFDVQIKVRDLEQYKGNCPMCKSEKVARFFTPPVIHFKGNGFYSTDNKVTEHG